MYDEEKDDVLGEDEFKMDEDELEIPEGMEEFEMDEDDPEDQYH